MVAAAGNEGMDACLTSPGYVKSAIIVGGLAQNDKPWFLGNFGTCVDIVAPAWEIMSLWPSGERRRSNGTSQAVPHVAGVAAVELAVFAFTPEEVLPWLVELSGAEVDIWGTRKPKLRFRRGVEPSDEIRNRGRQAPKTPTRDLKLTPVTGVEIKALDWSKSDGGCPPNAAADIIGNKVNCTCNTGFQCYRKTESGAWGRCPEAWFRNHRGNHACFGIEYGIEEISKFTHRHAHRNCVDPNAKVTDKGRCRCNAGYHCKKLFRPRSCRGRRTCSPVWIHCFSGTFSNISALTPGVRNSVKICEKNT